MADKVRIAAVGDIHVRNSDKGKWVSCFREVSEQADVLVICGDLTDTGDESEAYILAEDLKACKVPVVAVLGNHDYEKGRHKLIRQIMLDAQVHMLDGESVVVNGIGFAGVKGFGGGFDRYMLSMFGEAAMKAFVQETVDEVLHLDRALTALEKEHGDIPKIAVMHYAPIKDTLVGEPEVIFPFLGSSRLAEPLGRRQVLAAFHGHAHAGVLEGATADGVKVFNVALPILHKAGYQCGFFIYEV
ncbi:MAG: metallophosphoesterase [Bacteroidota bacterium]